MHEILMVIRREYLQSIRTKAFWIGTLAFPAAMMILLAAPIGLAFLSPDTRKVIAVTDETGLLLEPLLERLDDHELRDGRPEFVLEPTGDDGSVDGRNPEVERRVEDGALYGYLWIGDRLNGEDNFRLYRKNVGDERTADTLRDALRGAVVSLRLERSRLDVDRESLDAIMAPVRLASFQVSAGGETKRKGFLETYLAAYVFVMVLYFMIYFYGFAVTRGILQEKSNRIMEVLLGSLTPDQLVAGKILGIGLVGLTQAGIYLALAGSARLILGGFGVGSKIPEVPEINIAAFADAFTPLKLLYFVVFFLLGYFIFVSLFAIIGAACNNEQEAQYLQMPVLFCLMVPLLTAIFFVGFPDSKPAVVLSLVPLFTPMLMYMRISVLTPPLWQILLSIVLMTATIYFLFRAAAKVFRVGTLMYGKRPTVREIVRWARS